MNKISLKNPEKDKKLINFGLKINQNNLKTFLSLIKL